MGTAIQQSDRAPGRSKHSPSWHSLKTLRNSSRCELEVVRMGPEVLLAVTVVTDFCRDVLCAHQPSLLSLVHSGRAPLPCPRASLRCREDQVPPHAGCPWANSSQTHASSRGLTSDSGTLFSCLLLSISTWRLTRDPQDSHPEQRSGYAPFPSLPPRRHVCRTVTIIHSFAKAQESRVQH